MLGIARPFAKGRTRQQTHVILLGTATLFYWAALYVYVPALPVYALSLGASFAVVGLMVSAYGLSQLLLRIPVGLASDRLGQRKLFNVVGLLLTSAGCVVLFFAPNPTWLVIGRAVVGMSAATWVTITVTFSDYFEPSRVPGAMALLTFLGGMAQLVSMAVGGDLADRFGWHAPFLVGIGLGIIGALILLPIPEKPVIRTSPMSVANMVRIGTSPRLLQISIVGALLQFTFWATTYAFVPVYAHNLGASRTVLGLLASGALVPYSLAALGVSRWVSRWGATRFATVGLALCVVSPAVVPLIHSILLLGLSQAVGGLGRGLSMPVLLGLSIQGLAPSERATAMGVFQAVYAAGMFVGPASAGVIAQAIGLNGAFETSAVMCVAALAVLTLGRGRSATQRG